MLREFHEDYYSHHEDDVDDQEAERVLGSLFWSVPHAATSFSVLRVMERQGAPPSVRYMR